MTRQPDRQRSLDPVARARGDDAARTRARAMRTTRAKTPGARAVGRATRARDGGRARAREAIGARALRARDDADATDAMDAWSRARARSVSIVTAFVTAVTPSVAHAASVKEVEDYLLAFWHFRTADTVSVVLYTILPIFVPYAVFAVLIKDKKEKQLQALEAGGWVTFMKERGLDAEKLELPQLNAFVKAAEQGLLDDAMVQEFMRKLKLSEQWKKSTIAIEDNRAEEAKRRARAEAILEAKRARGDFN